MGRSSGFSKIKKLIFLIPPKGRMFVSGRIKKKHVWYLVFLVLFLLFWFSLPRPLFSDPDSTVLLDKDYNLLGAKISGDGQWRFPQSNKVPDKFKKAITHFEDRYFDYHPGFNP